MPLNKSLTSRGEATNTALLRVLQENSPKMGNFVREVVTLLHPHYFVNFVLSSVFFISKTTPPFCHALYGGCELEVVSLHDHDD